MASIEGSLPARASTAGIAQIGSAAATSALLSLQPAPPHWHSGERTLTATATAAGGLVDMWYALARALPLGDLWARVDLLAVPLLLVLAIVTTRAAHLLFRGPGRTLAAVVAGPLATLPAAAWTREVGSGAAVDALAAAIVAILVLAVVVRSRVRLGGIPPIAAGRALAATIAVGMFSPRTFFVLLPIVLGACVAGARRLHRRGFAVPPRRFAIAIAIGGAAPALAAVLLSIVSPAAEPLSPASLHLRAGVPAAWVPAMPAFFVYAGLALAGLMTFVLRWRGGLVLLAWIGAALLVADDHGPLVAPPLLFATLAIAIAGWVWLAGSIPRLPRRTATSLAATAATVLLGLGITGSLAWLPTSVAAKRPVDSVVDVMTRGLVGPRDVVVLHDPWLVEALSDRRAVEGWRPDVLVIDARELTEDRLADAALAWRDDGRRLLGDSWSLGGRWRPTWALDSGPLFWFVGPLDGVEPEFTDLSALIPPPETMPPDTAQKWLRLQVERARFRRAWDAPDEALAALPLSPTRHRGLLTRLQLSRSAKAEPGQGSELHSALPATTTPEALAGWVAAEAGDLLFSHGEHERATELLAEAANAGWTPAWGALVRWQIRAGLEDAAARTLDAMARDPALRDELLDLGWWLLRRDRADDVRVLLARLPAAEPPLAPAAELALRMGLLRAAVPPAEPVPPPPDGPAVAVE